MAGAVGLAIYDLRTNVKQALKARRPVKTIRTLVQNNPTKLREKDAYGGFLPLHYAAYYEAPLEVVKLLVEAYDQALQEKDAKGRLPLHIAAHYATMDVVQFLAREYPGALLVASNNGETPAAVAARFGKGVIAAWLKEEARSNNARPATGGTSGAAASQGPAARLKVEAPTNASRPATGGPPGAAASQGPAKATAAPVGSAPGQEPQGTAGTLSQGSKDPHERDRSNVLLVIEQESFKPVSVSPEYIELICAKKEKLGEGYFGIVYKGRDSVLDREFAVKMISSAILSGSEARATAVRTFEREMQVRAAWFQTACSGMEGRQSQLLWSRSSFSRLCHIFATQTS
jgi:hypothetical protein